MENVRHKLNLLLCFFLGGMVGAYVIGKFYFVPKHNEYMGMEDSLKSYSTAVMYQLIKNGKYEEAEKSMKMQSESLIKEKEIILSLIKKPENLERAKNSFERAEKLINEK